MAVRTRQRGFAMVEMMVNAAIVSLLAAFSLPSFTTLVTTQRLMSDARAIASDLSVARMRSAASFTRSRLSINTVSRTFQLELYDKTTNSWVVEGGTNKLSQGNTFSFGSITAPAGSQSSIAQSTVVLFNSRGIPIDNSGVPTGNYSVYITDGAGHHRAISVAASGLTNVWRHDSSGWVKSF